MSAMVTAVCVAIVPAPLVAQAGGPTSRTTKVKGTVNVGNFPTTQNVGGTVNVGNLPAVQHVDGTVNVGNEPAAQHVDGIFNVGNLRATQTVSGTVTANPGLPGQPFVAENYGSTPTVSVPAAAHLVVQTVSIYVTHTTGNNQSLISWSSPVATSETSTSP